MDVEFRVRDFGFGFLGFWVEALEFIQGLGFGGSGLL